MRIGIIGSGAVGQALGSGLAALGHEVKLGTREPTSDEVKSWVVKNGGKTSAGAFAEAAAHAEVAILATMWAGTQNALKLAGAKNLAGKVVIDATNPLDFGQGAPPKLALGHTDSGGEQVQRWLPDVRVVKAFNIVGNAHMVKPQFPGGPPDVFICGNDDGAKKTVVEICASLGWPVNDLGGARYLEPLAMVWIADGFRSNTWNHAFKLLKK